MCRIMEELTNESFQEGLAKGREEGRIEGRAEGLAEGLAEGRLKTLLTNVKKLMARGMSFDEVADTLELSKEDRKYIQDNL